MTGGDEFISFDRGRFAEVCVILIGEEGLRGCLAWQCSFMVNFETAIFTELDPTWPIFFNLNGTLRAILVDADDDAIPNLYWVANKRFEISRFKLKLSSPRTYELIRALLGCIEAKFCN